MTETENRRIELQRDLVLEFLDQTNRYFGDYHRVQLEVFATVESAAGKLCLRYHRPLRKMGVASAAVNRERDALIEQFLATTAPYMRQGDFVRRLLQGLERPGQQIWIRVAALS